MNFKHPYIWQDESVSHRFSEQDFDLAHWQRNGGVPLAGGRGGSCRIQIAGEDFVLRRYLRGGLMARMLGDRYVWTGLASSRPYRETKSIGWAVNKGLPVPRIAAYLVSKSGLYYRAAIISQFVVNQGTLASFLYATTLGQEHWRALGQLIRALHEAGIFHSDLNANNILVTDPLAFYLIDFDKARAIVGDADRLNNLERLHRSLLKIQNQRAEEGLPFHFADADWACLLAGYEASPR